MRKLMRTICREDAISRLPALFAYIDYSYYGGSVIHQASDSIDGCYGKIVEALEVPCALTVDGETIIRAHSTYTYREMMNAYYAYRDVVGRDNPFIEFVENGIGEVDVRVFGEEHGFAFGDECDLIPERLYISQATDMLSEMRRLRNLCVLNEELTADGTKDFEICCECQKYPRLGGDDMILLLRAMNEEFVSRSAYYYTLARKGEGSFSLQLPLFSEHTDIGVMTTYMDELAPGHYENGTIVTYTKYDSNGKLVDVNGYTVTVNEEDGINVVSKDCTGDVGFDNGKYTKRTTNAPDVYIDTFGESRLPTLRSSRKYSNSAGVEVTPDYGEDWLWYYKVQTPRNMRVIVVDSNGEFESATCDYIDTIVLTRETDEDIVTGYSLTFDYYIGAKVEYASNVYTFTNIEGCKHFTETYGALPKDVDETTDETTTDFDKLYSEQSDFKTLIQSEDGLDYEFDTSENDTVYKYPDRRFRFNVLPSMRYESVPYENGEIKISYRSGDYTQRITHDDSEVLNLPVFKDDAIPAFPFRPHVVDDVYIQRGDNAAFERHIRLSEIRTLEDLTNYANGGYYKVERLT